MQGNKLLPYNVNLPSLMTVAILSRACSEILLRISSKIRMACKDRLCRDYGYEYAITPIVFINAKE